MDKLPPEILYKIFIQVDLQERLTCLTVCTCWWNVLDKGALFYSFIITNNNQFRRFMRGFERLPGRATQVEEISIHGLTRFYFINKSMFDTLPSVRNISVQRSLISHSVISMTLYTPNQSLNIFPTLAIVHWYRVYST
jgi:hypothetical protein